MEDDLEDLIGYFLYGFLGTVSIFLTASIAMSMIWRLQ